MSENWEMTIIMLLEMLNVYHLDRHYIYIYIYIYKKVKLGSLINKETIKEEIDSDMELDRIDNVSRDKNPYKELIVNNAIKVENALWQME